MTQPGRLSGLLTAVLADKSLREALGAVEQPRLELEGPPAGRPLLVAALATERPVLAITATGREADELAAIAKDLLGPDAVELFPSWETLPHERLSPRADTVGRRLEVLRRLAHPEEHPAGGIKVIVATIRSLIQPMAPQLGELAPVHLEIGAEHDFLQLVERLAELAYVRVDMVEKRGEFAVRGGILDVFPPTSEHPGPGGVLGATR
ncbi:hypothetical protein [Kutzneria sp. 744]|uniref:hypothetical protein n=1 Tax=Kutzneria sp. (strain 744) TaxID=345341 RepID=UPI0004B59D9A|nr:hypothetical protein [Kutzneria sp. 744]